MMKLPFLPSRTMSHIFQLNRMTAVIFLQNEALVVHIVHVARHAGEPGNKYGTQVSLPPQDKM